MRWRSRGTAAATWASWRRSPWVLLALGGVLSTLLLAGCRDDSVLADPAPGGDVTAGPSSSTGSLPDDGETTPGTAGSTSYAVAAPGPLRARLFHADVLVRSGRTLPDALVKRVRGIRGVQAVLPISLAQTSVEGRTLDVAAVDPAAFRRYTPEASARANFVWKRLAGGEVVVDIDVSRKLVGEGDVLRLGTRDDSPEVHVGAYAPLVQQARGVQTFPAISAVVNVKRGAQLGIPEHNALLVSTGDNTPSSLEKEFDRALGDRATLQVLAREFDLGPQTAVLSGVSVTDAVGTFDYRDNGDGTITPNPAWVQEYIRTEQVPILGSVTCNKGMLPQLRGALEEIVRSGLGDKIHPDEYAGCYYPRYIGRDPSNGLSLHSWGIAVDLNVPGNQRGTVGEIDRRVVAIFKRWGFAWGGDWNYTDPMHFEMNRVVRAR